MKNEIKARIEKENNGGLWLIIDGGEGNAWALTEDEVLPIYTALQDYMVKGKGEK